MKHKNLSLSSAQRRNFFKHKVFAFKAQMFPVCARLKTIFIALPKKPAVAECELHRITIYIPLKMKLLNRAGTVLAGKNLQEVPRLLGERGKKRAWERDKRGTNA